MTKRDQRRRARLEELTQLERQLYEDGTGVVAGIDEAGRGALAGPVVAACVTFRPGTWIPGVDDSKKLTAARRTDMYERILASALAVSTGICDVDVIERINILEATREASLKSLHALGVSVDHLFTDALKLDVQIPVTSMVRADQKVYCVAAASIIAKVTRDRIMEAMDKRFPGYGFLRNKGYGTQEHCKAILELGATPVHRPTFLRRILGKR